MTHKNAYQQVLNIVGNQNKLATLLGINAWAVYKWNPDKPPKQRCLAMQELTNNEVTAEMLRPDINWNYEREYMNFSIPLPQPEEA